jgi:hypothetical protein
MQWDEIFSFEHRMEKGSVIDLVVEIYPFYVLSPIVMYIVNTRL